MLGCGGAAAQTPDCAIRQAKAASAWAEVLVRADKTTDNAFGGRGDHCDEQAVEGRVVQAMAGPLSVGQPIRFSLSQGQCGEPDSVNDDFVAPGAQLVLLLRRTAASEIYQVRAESPAVFEAREKACRR